MNRYLFAIKILIHDLKLSPDEVSVRLRLSGKMAEKVHQKYINMKQQERHRPSRKNKVFLERKQK